MSGGFSPVSAVLADDHIMDVWRVGSHGSTFSGNPLGSVASITALDILNDEGLVENSKQKGVWLLNEMQRIKPDWMKDIRGRGLWFG